MASHDDSAGANFMSDLMKGLGSREDYVALVAQHYFLYEALEAAEQRFADDPAAAAFITPQLTRLPALEADMAFLAGPSWRESFSPVAATERYIERIEKVAAEGWSGGFIAHHYTRYLGDLSGGQAIGAMIARHYGATPGQLAFAHFAQIEKPVIYKREYREALDALDFTDAQRQAAIDEARAAFDFNAALFDELGSLADAA